MRFLSSFSLLTTYLLSIPVVLFAADQTVKPLPYAIGIEGSITPRYAYSNFCGAGLSQQQNSPIYPSLGGFVSRRFSGKVLRVDPTLSFSSGGTVNDTLGVVSSGQDYHYDSRIRFMNFGLDIPIGIYTQHRLMS